MLKITRHGSLGAGQVLELEGTLGGAWVEELRAACDAVLAKELPVVLDLQGVTFVDRAGAEQLESLRANPRVRLARASAFVAALLNGGAA